MIKNAGGARKLFCKKPAGKELTVAKQVQIQKPSMRFWTVSRFTQIFSACFVFGSRYLFLKMCNSAPITILLYTGKTCQRSGKE